MTTINTNLAALISTVEDMADELVAMYNQYNERVIDPLSSSEIEWLETGITPPPLDIVVSEHDDEGYLWWLCYDDGRGMFYLATSNPLTPEGVEVETEGSTITFRAGDAEIRAEGEEGEAGADWLSYLLHPLAYQAFSVRVGDRKVSYGRNGYPRTLDWTGMQVDKMSSKEYYETRKERIESAIRFREETEAAFGLTLY